VINLWLKTDVIFVSMEPYAATKIEKEQYMTDFNADFYEKISESVRESNNKWRVINMQLDIGAIKARCEAATPGLWCNDGCVIKIDGRKTVIAETYGLTRDIMDANAKFIAHAHEDIPALLDALKDAEAELERYEHTAKLYRSMKARAEALERALKQKAFTPCSTCVKKPPKELTGIGMTERYCDDLHDCINGENTYPCWVFDHERYGHKLIKEG